MKSTARPGWNYRSSIKKYCWSKFILGGKVLGDGEAGSVLTRSWFILDVSPVVMQAVIEEV